MRAIRLFYIKTILLHVVAICWMLDAAHILPHEVYVIYINKEELKTVGRDILACAQPNRHETFTAL